MLGARNKRLVPVGRQPLHYLIRPTPGTRTPQWIIEQVLVNTMPRLQELQEAFFFLPPPPPTPSFILLYITTDSRIYRYTIHPPPFCTIMPARMSSESRTGEYPIQRSNANANANAKPNVISTPRCWFIFYNRSFDCINTVYINALVLMQYRFRSNRSLAHSPYFWSTSSRWLLNEWMMFVISTNDDFYDLKDCPYVGI